MLTWLDWCIYAYWPSLMLTVAGFCVLYYATYNTLNGISAAVFIGSCVWVVWAWVRQGFGVG